nr:ankyrin repeat-containing protein [Tanacetum cinerariifolium]
MFQNYSGNMFGDARGIFANTTVQPTSSTVHGSERGWQPRSDHRMRKLKMPLFDGEDVYGWVYQAERFFEVQGLNTTGERLRAAVLSLEGLALSWFRWINNREPFHNWEELKRRLLHRFQSSQDERRAKGLCFRCEEKFKPGHRCAPSTLKVMIVDDSDEEKELYLQVKPWDRALKAD